MTIVLPFNYKIFVKNAKYEKNKDSIVSDYGKVTFSMYEKGLDIIKTKNMLLRRKYEKTDIDD